MYYRALPREAATGASALPEHLKPLQTSLALDAAERIVDEAIAIRRREGLLPLAVAVLDAGGNPVAFKREDGAGVMRFEIARGKAYAALGMGMSTRLIRDRLANRPAFQSALAAVSDGRFIPTPGGVLILDRAGRRSARSGSAATPPTRTSTARSRP